MDDEGGPLDADRRFFSALIDGSLTTLNTLLADDFILIDVMSGSEVSRSAMLEAIGSGQLKFGAIELIESRLRQWGKAAIVTGRTRMSLRFGEIHFTANSRYTHVYVDESAGWRLVSAQGTQISGA